MRIGFDGSCLSNRRGFGRFARQILAALAEAQTRHQFVVFVDRPSLEQVQVPSCFETLVADVRQAPSRAASARGRRGVRDLVAMGRAVARAGLDLIYFPASYSFFPVWNCPRVVVTLFDTLPLAYPELVFPHWRGRVAWTLKEHAAARWADRIVTASEASRRDLIAWFGLPPHKVAVVGAGTEAVFRPLNLNASSDEVLIRYGLRPGTRFLLYVGGLSPHKNLLRLIDAFAIAAPDDVRLVLVGDFADVFHTHVPALRAAVTRQGRDDRVTFTGFVPDHDLVHLYNHAYCLIQPSLMEGFGLPPVEAMACGTPVLHSRAGSLPEVVDDAGIPFDPNDTADIAGAIRRLLDDPALRNRLAARSLERSRRYTWPAAARALLDCFDALDPCPGLARGA